MMRKFTFISVLIAILTSFLPVAAQEGTIPSFEFEPNPIALKRLARPGTPFQSSR